MWQLPRHVVEVHGSDDFVVIMLRPRRFDNIGSLLRHRIYGCTGMSAYRHGKDTSVHNPEVLNTVDTKLRIDNTTEILRQHRTCRRRMLPRACGKRPDARRDLRIRADVGARVGLHGTYLLHWTGGHPLADLFERLDCNGKIGGMAEGAEVDDRRCVWVGGIDVHCAS